MRKLINTFKYGSWATRVFFGVIALAFIGGAATIATAAVAGLGLIPMAIGGAAVILGIGMSTMVTVISDDKKDKDGVTEDGNDDSKDGNNLSKEIDLGEGISAGEESAAKERKDKSEDSLEKGRIEVIKAEDDGSYIPDIIVEKYPEKATYTNDERSKSAEGRKVPADGEAGAGSSAGNDSSLRADGADSKGSTTVTVPADGKSSAVHADSTVSNAGTSSTDRTDDLGSSAQTGGGDAAGTKSITGGVGAAENTAAIDSSDPSEEKNRIQSEEEYRNALKAQQSVKKAEERVENRQNRQAERQHIKDGSNRKAVRREEKHEIKRKTGEYGDSLEEKFENELSYAEKEKLREDDYEKGLKAKKKERKKREKSENKEKKGFGRIRDIFRKLFANVHDEPEELNAGRGRLSEEDRGDRLSRLSEEDRNDSRGRISEEDRSDSRSRISEEDRDTGNKNTSEDDNGKQKKIKNKKEKKVKDKKEKKDKNKKKQPEKEKEPVKDKKQSRQDIKDTDKEDIIPEETVPGRLPGEEIDVSKYTQGNMKRIIKANKIGKDYIPVFIESWKNRSVDKTPALCYVREDKVHFLLLEGERERDVSIPLNRFINVWYKRNVTETNIRAYQNIKENMGAYEMFENVMPNVSGNTDQTARGGYTRNLYLLGNDIEVAPPTMRELRKRFRFNTNIFDSLDTKGNYSDDFKKAYENRILWTDNVIGMQEYQRRIRAILQEMVNSDELSRYEFEEDVSKMVQYRLITDEYAEFYLKLRRDKK